MRGGYMAWSSDCIFDTSYHTQRICSPFRYQHQACAREQRGWSKTAANQRRLVEPENELALQTHLLPLFPDALGYPQVNVYTFLHICRWSSSMCGHLSSCKHSMPTFRKNKKLFKPPQS
ncbi:hypothetical protein GDO78_004988 [Eleutherodactylus coqui]|uniref:Uncharacterized protein n=1 Tax=Eleutherodactylus coqui TaxID=57060 RepID=A0A8J6FIM7_ELECQ|nr:hypothetical protein GDO78_004988 [Eleutherodactylus coqui]